MLSILIKAIEAGHLKLFLNKEDENFLIEKIKEIKKQYLYSSSFHGLHHSEKVLLFSYLIGKNQGLNREEMEILLDAAVYHDIGRENENEDAFHGMVSANRINPVIGNKTIYQKQYMLDILKAVCDAHSRNDSDMERAFDDYSLPQECYEMYKKIAIILKDADALDRTRFRKTASHALKESFLRSEYAKTLVNLAYSINAFYRDAISENFYQRYNKPSEQETVCCHGIGFNFATLESILGYGILSAYAKKKKGLDGSRNFNGNNNELWISVTVGEGEAKEMFVDSGISFECGHSNLRKGIKSTSQAQSEGLPVDSGRYSDEQFAFYEIPLENIRRIRINPKCLDINIDELNYLMGSMNYDSLVANIDSYLNYLRINYDYFPDVTMIEKLKTEYREFVAAFEKLSQGAQKRMLEVFFKELESKTAVLNQEIQKMMKDVFTNFLKKDQVTLRDVLTHIFAKKGLTIQANNGEFEADFAAKKI